jgi:hypothetical protein
VIGKDVGGEEHSLLEGFNDRAQKSLKHLKPS